MRKLTYLLAALALPLAARAQDLTVKAPPQSKPVCIINATVHPVSGEKIESGYVYFVDGVIQAVGREPLPRFASAPEFVDAKGKHVYPGMIAAYSQLGITEIGAVRASRDIDETGSATPEALAAVAVNPDSWMFPVTRVNGVLSAGVFPQGGLIPGRASVITLDGWTIEEMAVKRDAGLVVSWPLMRAVRAWWVETSEQEQVGNIKENIQRARDTFIAATTYFAAKAADPAMPTDVRWEPMRSVFPPGPEEKRAQLPVFFEASDYDQIVAAVAFAREFKLKAVIVGGRDAWLCADLLRKDDIPVIINSTLLMPKRDDSAYDEVYQLPKKLLDAGVRFCLASGEETPHERNLPYAAAMAVAHGLPAEAALKSVTLWPAQILGVEAELGTLEAGKSATLIITDGDPLEVTTQIEGAYIHGRAIPMTSKQTELAAKYREKYRQKSGQGAPIPAPQPAQPLAPIAPR